MRTVEGVDELLKKLERLGDDAQAAQAAMLAAGGEVLRRAAASRAPGPHIEMTAAKPDKLGRASVLIGPDKPHWYYKFLEFGAGGHELTARAFKATRSKKAKQRNASKQVLVFPGPGGLVFARSAKHPGFAARPFLRPAVDEKWPEVQQAMGDVLLERIEKIAGGGK
jgi:HK97 gp10 family phage protein